MHCRFEIRDGVATCLDCGNPITTRQSDPAKIFRRCRKPSGEPLPRAAERPRPLRSVPVPCTLRGPQIGTLEATRCGMQGEVYPVHACPVHGSCVLYTICRRQEVQACEACRERNLPRSAPGGP